MSDLNSIHDFFLQIGCHYQCYDMSRLITPIEPQAFFDFEQTNLPWQAPFMQHAWLALVFWRMQDSSLATDIEHTQQHNVWFLKFPLDEQAKLNLAARDDFLRRLYKALEDYLTAEQTAQRFQQLEANMKDNPYGFQPKQEQMANFHAIVQKHLMLPASGFYEPAQDYFSQLEQTSSDTLNQWTQLGIQGVADFCARLDEQYHQTPNETLAINAITYLPLSPLQVVCNCLENHTTSSTILEAIQNRLDKEKQAVGKSLNVSDLALFAAALVRASAMTEDYNNQKRLIREVLESPIARHIEVLAAISGRCWIILKEPDILSLFLEALAKTDQGQGAFHAIITDLMFIPGMRDLILQAFRSPVRSNHLATAIGAFFQQLAQK